MPLPVITEIPTPRLRLRPVLGADLPDLLQINGDDEVTRFLPYGSWRGPEDGTTWLARMQALGEAGTGRQLVVERRADAKVVGTVLLFRHDEASARLELGYVIGRAHWRCGYAREALRAALRCAFAELGIRRVEAEVDPANLASNRLLLALGFVHEGRLRQRWVAKGRAYDTHLYGCLAEEWLAADAAVNVIT